MNLASLKAFECRTRAIAESSTGCGLWGRVREDHCAACNQRIRPPLGHVIAGIEPAGPGSRLVILLCTACAPRLPGDLDLLFKLQCRLSRRCPGSLLAPLTRQLATALTTAGVRS